MTIRLRRLIPVALTACASLSVAHRAVADTDFIGADQGKLHLTAGFNDVEGAGGAGLVPLAFITGYGSSDSWGGNAHVTTVHVNDFQLTAYGVAVGALDRFELSFARHEFEAVHGPLDGLGVDQDIIGLKVRLVGNTLYQQDSWLPQIALGAQYKKNKGIKDAANVGLAGVTNVTQLGAEDDSGTDFYLSATKIFLGQSLVVDLNLRYTKANQFGLLGFGGAKDDGYSLKPEVAVAYLFTRQFAGGFEFRAKPENLSIDTEDNAWDAFVAWTPTRNISLVAAYVNLGSILGPVTSRAEDQKGAYLSFQVGF
jgi:Protein of unknown function (DUF3034)